MAIREPSFTIGIEEEYLLVDKETRDLAPEPPAALLAKCQEALPGQVSPEFLRSQIEVGTTGLPLDARSARPISSACAPPWARSPASSASPPSPPRPTPSPNGRASSTPTRSATTCSPRICSRWRGGSSSAACMSMSASRTTSSASICSARPPISCRICSRSRPPRHSGRATSPGSNPTGSRCSTSCRAPACRINSRATANISAPSSSWSAPA